MGVHVAIKVDGIVRWALAFWLFIAAIAAFCIGVSSRVEKRRRG